MPGLFVRRLVAPLVPLLLLAGCAESAEPAAPPPTTSPTPSAVTADSPTIQPTPASESAEQIVDNPKSRLLDVMVDPTDPDLRVAVWKKCSDRRCTTVSAAVALSVDGFKTRVVPDRVWRDNPQVRLSASGDALVYVWGSRLKLTVVRPDGSSVAVRRSNLTAPVAPGEIVGGVTYHRGRQSFYATDPVSAVAHRIPVPKGTVELEALPSGQLRALTMQRTYAWSDDGGETWQHAAGTLDKSLLWSFVASTPDVHVFVGGGDGATLFPFNQIRRMDSWDSWSVVDQPKDPTAYIGRTAVLPDGRFLASVEAWSDNGRVDRLFKGTPPGSYVSAGDDWSTYERIEPGAPFTTLERGQPYVIHIDVRADGALLTALGPDSSTAWTSRDLGVTWQRMRVR